MNTPYASPSLYVGDLDSDISEALLYDLFSVVGAVASIRVCRDSVTRRSLGYAYVNFHQVQDAERALDTMNYTLIRGRPCRIMWSARNPALRKSGEGNIFVRGLDKSIDHTSLYDTFSAFGNILSCKVMTDDAGDSLGYGFVHFASKESAENAIAKLNGMLLNGKMVYVGHFVPKSERGASEPRFSNVYVKNIPLEWDDAALSAHFASAGEITSAVVRMSPEGVSRGFGFVNFGEPDHARAAIEAFNGTVVEGAPKNAEGETLELVVTRAQKKAEREKALQKKFEQVRVERLKKYQGTNLFVKNLDDAIDDDALREAFAEFGTVTSAKVMRTPDTNASRGFGFVSFSSQEEAARAVAEMSSRLIGSKPIYVALAERRDVRRVKLEQQHAQRRGPQAQAQGGVYPGQAPVFYANAGQQRNMYPQQVGIPRPRWGQGPPPAGARNGNGQGAPAYMMQQNGAAMPMAAQQPVLMPQQAQAPAPAGQEPLTPSVLADATPDMQKRMLGERLYPLVHAFEPVTAGKITGMLLEMDNGELLNLLESAAALKEKVAEAVHVLNEHTE